MIKQIIKGKYKFNIQIATMFNIYEITTNYTNIITNDGAYFIINTLATDDINKIEKICLGDGISVVSKSDTDLLHQTDILETEVTISTNKITLNSSTNGNTVNGTTEIGVKSSNGLLISRDVHEEILVPETANVNIVYEYDFNFGEYMTGWIKSPDLKNIYQLQVNSSIYSIIEEDTNSGYVKQDNINQVITNPGSYLYDSANSLLYIHCTDSTNPNLHEIIINTKGDE